MSSIAIALLWYCLWRRFNSTSLIPLTLSCNLELTQARELRSRGKATKTTTKQHNEWMNNNLKVIAIVIIVEYPFVSWERKHWTEKRLKFIQKPHKILIIFEGCIHVYTRSYCAVVVCFCSWKRSQRVKVLYLLEHILWSREELSAGTVFIRNF